MTANMVSSKSKAFLLGLLVTTYVVPFTESEHVLHIHDLLVGDLTSRERAVLLDQLLDTTHVGLFHCPTNDTTTPGENHAAGKTALQSSTFQPSRGPNAAVDDNTNCDWSSNSVSHTYGEINPWWMVDMGTKVCVRRVVIYNRDGCCGDFLRNFKVTVSQERDGDSIVCGMFHGASTDGAIETINCQRPIFGGF